MRWSYKTEHFSLKKDGLLGSSFLDEEEIELSLNEYGKSGWELVSFMEVNDGLIAVFKQPFGHGLPGPEEDVGQDEDDVTVKPVVGTSPVPESVVKPSVGNVQPDKDVAEKEGKNPKDTDDGDVGAIRIA